VVLESVGLRAMGGDGTAPFATARPAANALSLKTPSFSAENPCAAVLSFARGQ
jgi:hypothetical protein